MLARFGGFDARGFDEGGHVAVDKQSDIYVAEAGHDRILKLSPDGKPMASWRRDRGPGLDQWNQPETISVDGDGNLVIADFGNHRVLTLSPTGQTISAFDGVPNEPLRLASISSTVVSPAGHIYVADYQLYRVQEFDSHGSLLATIGNTPGDTLFQLAPNSIGVDPQGDLYATDGLSVIDRKSVV